MTDMEEREVLHFTVPAELAGGRLDAVLSTLQGELTRSHVQKLIEEGHVFISGKGKMKPSLKLMEGDQIELVLPPPDIAEIKAEDIPLDILYEDDDLLIVNKPKGMVVHPAPGHTKGTLVNAVMYHCGDQLSGINGTVRPGIVHRIDRDTTGALVICKNDKAHLSLAEQLKDHSITRRYVGIVHGAFREDNLTGTIDAPLDRDPRERKRMAIVPGGRRAVTHYRVLRHLSYKGNPYSFCEFTLETGRTHQIRVHMASIHHPLLGDAVYGPRTCPFRLEGQTLHAQVLGFRHPADGRYIEVSAPLPPYFEDLLARMGEER